MRNAFRDRLNHVLHSYSIGPANSSVGRASDCSSEGHRFKPGLVDVNLTFLTRLVEQQPHELKNRNETKSCSPRSTCFLMMHDPFGQ